MLFYGGLIAALIALILFLLCFFLYRVRSGQLKRKLTEEYGKAEGSPRVKERK